MRILLVAPFPPDRSASHGGGLYLGALCEGLAQQSELGLVAMSRPDDGPRRDRVFAWQGMVTYLGTAAHPRALGHRARMLWRWGMRGQPLVAAKHWQPQLPRLLRQALHEFRPDAVLVEHAAMAQYLPWLQDQPTILTDHEAGAPERSVTDLGAWADQRDLRLWHRYVGRFYPLAGALQALTEEDAGVLGGRLGRAVGRRRPAVPVPDEPVAPARAGPRALFLGDYRHHPNHEAVRVLVREVLPRLRAQLPEAELCIAGPNPDRLRDLQGTPGVRLMGFVPDLRALLGSVRCLLAPLYSGGGFRIKALTALAHGLPVVTNALGARGADAPAPARQVTEDPAQLAEAALRLMRDPGHAATAGAAAFAWARANLAPERVAAEQIERLRQLLAQPKPSRPAAAAAPAPAAAPRAR